jgi:TFIIF-interacting CTD phosphatase-like protein
MYMYVRPGLRQFLLDISKYFEIVLFSNGSQLYTIAVVDKLLEKINAKDEI